jgi:PleD family two-component response regulator
MKAKLKRKLFLFHWEKDGAMARAAELNAEGWRVEMEYEEGSRGCKNLKAFGPDVVVFDIAQKAVHSRECGRALRNARAYRETPFIFVDGTDEDISKAKAKVPGAIFTSNAALTKILAKHTV